jgi:hypothetical protein
VKIAAVAAVVLSLCLGVVGFLIGRHFPAHHYTLSPNPTLVFDSTTGMICSTVKPAPDDNPFAKIIDSPNKSTSGQKENLQRRMAAG